MYEIRAVRVYDLKEDTKGYRILVDRLWPRGIRKEALCLDEWAGNIAPSRELRQWFSHAEKRFDPFEDAYRAELSRNPKAQEVVYDAQEKLKEQDVLLLYAAKSPDCNHAIILRDWLNEKLSETVK